MIPDGGAWQFQGNDENGLLRSLSGRVTGVHKVFCSAAEIARKGRQRFLLGTRRWIHDPGSQQHWSRNENSFWEIGELVWKGRTHPSVSRKQQNQFLPEPRSEIHRDQSCEQRSAVGKRVWQSSALVSPTKTLNRDVAPIGDDIEPIEVPRADVEMGNDEDEEPLEAESPRVRMHPKNPTSREKQEH